MSAANQISEEVETEQAGEDSMTDIYYVEDDADIAETVKDFLERRGYRVALFPTIASAKQAIADNCPALVLADWNMPDGDGKGLCRWIRLNRKELPVIFLTVRDEARDMIAGFENGADDYVVKPFSLDVLLLRIQALLRRAGDVSGRYLTCGQISLDQDRQLVLSGGEETALSPQEYQLLLYLLQNKGKTVPREMLLARIWDSSENYVNDNTLTVTVKRLREKLRMPDCLKTVRSIGYRMEERE